MNFSSKITRATVSWTLRYPKITLLIFLLSIVGSVHLIGQIKLRSNFSDLLPDDHPAVVQARRLNDIVGGASFVVVAAQTKKSEPAIQFLDDFNKQVQHLDGIRYIDDRPPAEFFKREGLLYLSLEDLNRLKNKISRRLQQEKLKKTNLLIDLDDDDDEDPFSELSKTHKGYESYLKPNARYQNKEGTLFVSLIKPDWRVTNVAKSKPFLKELNQIIKTLDPKKYDPSLTIRLTGPYVKTEAQQDILKKDALKVSLLSIFGAIAYLIFHFRQKRAVFLIGTPLITSALWTLALAYLFFGSLNLFSSVACAIIMGLAADYGIHIYSEYLRHRARGDDTRESLLLAIEHLGRPFFMAATTTACSFYALAYSDFKAFHEMGLITGSGIIACMISFLFVFPPLVLMVNKFRPLSARHFKRKLFHVPAPLLKWIFSKKSFILMSFLLLLPVLSVAFGRIHFDYNMGRIMGTQPTRALDSQVDEIFNHTVNPEVALTELPEDAAPLSKAIREVSKKNKNSPKGTTIQEVLSLPDLVPDSQREKRKVIREIRVLFTPTLIKGFNKKERDSYDQFKVALRPRGVRLKDIPEKLTRMFQDRTGAVGRIVLIFQNFDMNHADKMIDFVEEIRQTECTNCKGNFYASGESTVFSEIVKMLFEEGKYVMSLALLVTLGALLFNFRSLTGVLLSFSSVGIGLASTLGWMGILNIPFNIVNLAALPIILGTAIDYAIHLYQRAITHTESIQDSYEITFRPILGSTFTTLIGFGSLLTANMGGVRTFGALSVLGISLCAITTLFWFPGLLSLVKKRKMLET